MLYPIFAWMQMNLDNLRGASPHDFKTELEAPQSVGEELDNPPQQILGVYQMIFQRSCIKVLTSVHCLLVNRFEVKLKIEDELSLNNKHKLMYVSTKLDEEQMKRSYH